MKRVIISVGYSLQEILPVALLQNAALHKKPKSAISTVRNKYSHTIFFEVAKVPLIEDSTLMSSWEKLSGALYAVQNIFRWVQFFNKYAKSSCIL